MLTTYEIYRKCCPNSQLNEWEITEPEMISAISIVESNFSFRIENKAAAQDPDDIRAYEKWKSTRVKNSLNDLKEWKVEKLKNAISMYMGVHGEVRSIRLSGSYASGSWIDEYTPKEEREVREKIKACKAISDFDLVPEPFNGYALIDGVEFSNAAKGRSFLIYENGHFLCS